MPGVSVLKGKSQNINSKGKPGFRTKHYDPIEELPVESGHKGMRPQGRNQRNNEYMMKGLYQ